MCYLCTCVLIYDTLYYLMQTIQRSLRRGWGQACVCRRGWVTAWAVKSESCVRFYYKSEMTAPNLGIQEDEANHQTILYFIAPLAFLIFQAHKPPASQFFIPHIWSILLKGQQWGFFARFRNFWLQQATRSLQIQEFLDWRPFKTQLEEAWNRKVITVSMKLSFLRSWSCKEALQCLAQLPHEDRRSQGLYLFNS